MDASPQPNPENVLDVLPAGPRGASWLWSCLALLGYALFLLALLLVSGNSSLFLFLAIVAAVNAAIWLHGLGHWLMARLTGVPVQTWSLGCGSAWFGCQFQRGGTWFRLGLVPLGGYVRLAESAPGRSLRDLPLWRGLAVYTAGGLASLLALICGLLAIGYQPEEQLTGVIGAVEPGLPAWAAGAQSGATIHRIGDVNEPSFNDLLRVLAFRNYASPEVAFDFALPGEPIRQTTIRPRRNSNDATPLIGVSPPSSVRLVGPRLTTSHRRPAFIGSPADRAAPPLAFGDEIIGATDQDSPETVQDLPADPRNPTSARGDYFELHRRMKRLAGREMTVRVRRPDVGDIDVRIPPAHHRTLGLRMHMGWITAVRPDSPAERAGLQAVNQRVNGRKVRGDYLNAVEVANDDGTTLRWTRLPHDLPPKGLEDKPLDPLRLPFELEQWAARKQGPRQVTLWVVRHNGTADEQLELKADWDERWRYSEEIPLSVDAPQSIPALGLAYSVDNVVAAIEPDSPATRSVGAGGDSVPLQPGDTIIGTRLHLADGRSAPRQIAVGPHQWANFFHRLQRSESSRVALEVQRGTEVLSVTLETQPDASWPLTDRGLVFEFDYRSQTAEGPGEALLLGLSRSVVYVLRILYTLKDLVVRSFAQRLETLGGPVMILANSDTQGPQFLYTFCHWLVLASAALFLVNCLPVPILDAGNGVLLLVRKLRGKSAEEPSALPERTT